MSLVDDLNTNYICAVNLINCYLAILVWVTAIVSLTAATTTAEKNKKRTKLHLKGLSMKKNADENFF